MDSDLTKFKRQFDKDHYAKLTGIKLIDIENEEQELIAHFKGTVYRKNEILPFE